MAKHPRTLLAVLCGLVMMVTTDGYDPDSKCPNNCGSFMMYYEGNDEDGFKGCSCAYGCGYDESLQCCHDFDLYCGETSCNRNRGRNIPARDDCYCAQDLCEELYSNECSDSRLNLHVHKDCSGRYHSDDPDHSDDSDDPDHSDSTASSIVGACSGLVFLISFCFWVRYRTSRRRYMYYRPRLVTTTAISTSTTARPTTVQYSVIGNPAENINGPPVGMVVTAPVPHPGSASASASDDNMHYDSLPSGDATAPPPVYKPASSSDGNQGL